MTSDADFYYKMDTSLHRTPGPFYQSDIVSASNMNVLRQLHRILTGDEIVVMRFPHWLHEALHRGLIERRCNQLVYATNLEQWNKFYTLTDGQTWPV